MEFAAFAALAIAAVSVACSLAAVRRAKRQIARMTEALADVKGGNGNRRVLSAADELAAPLAYAINETVTAYEDRLAAYRRTEETHRQLMTSLSHDVRTPLTTLIGYLDAVHRNPTQGVERECDIETARRKAHDLQAYLDVLFDWFKLGSDDFAMRIAPVEAAELTRDLLIDWIPVFEDKRIDYEIEIPERPFVAGLDPDGYRRILNNLIQNAVSHSQANRIGVTLSRREADLCVRIADNGIGMSQEDLAHIFERLYRCEPGRRGSGLGLAIVRQLVEKMGGRIDVESRPGNGTAFTLLFPLSAESSAAPSRVKPD